MSTPQGAHVQIEGGGELLNLCANNYLGLASHPAIVEAAHEELEARLREASDARYRLIATDGVFSMDGYLARLDRICELAEQHGALVMVDDSHAVGVVGAEGRGTHEHHGVVERVDILTGTLGKAIGGASGGYGSGRRGIVGTPRQRARAYPLPKSVAPPR